MFGDRQADAGGAAGSTEIDDPGALFEVDSLWTIPVDAVNETVRSLGFAIIRGVASPDEVRYAVASARRVFSPDDDHPTVGESPADVRGNFQKWSIGTAGASRKVPYSRMIRVIFTPFLDEDRYGLQDLLRRVAITRNLMHGLPADYAIDAIENDRWTAARVLQYPSGGGFIDRHVDTAVVDALPSNAATYLQLLMVLTERGVDFERGGAYIEVDGVRIDLEDHVQLGDLLLYDEQTVHGVADIDPHRVLDTRTLSGRMAGFANIYRAL